MDVIYNKRVEELIKVGSNHVQGSEEWYRVRNSMITASDACTALGENPYETKHSLMIKKCMTPVSTPLPPPQISSSSHMAWGHAFEPVATQVFCSKNKMGVDRVSHTGCIRSKWDTFLGASPDGVLPDGRLLEIKCPVTRTIRERIPHMYWVQMQIQMEVCRLDTCVFVQCKFHTYDSHEEYCEHHGYCSTDPIPTKDVFLGDHGYLHSHGWYWRLTVYQEQTVYRDPVWYRTVRPKLVYFWNRVLYYRMNGGIEDVLPENQPLTQTHLATGNPDPWVPFTSIRHTMMKDSFLDLVEHRVQKSVLDPPFKSIQYQLDPASRFVSVVNERSKAFLESILDIWKSDDSLSVIQIWDSDKEYVISNTCPFYKSTRKAMDQGYDIIYNAVLHNKTNYTYGVVDVLIRAESLTTVFPGDGFTRLSSYHPVQNEYVVCMVRDVKLPLCKNGVNVKNTPGMNVVKGVSYLMNQALGVTQGRTPPESYILGNRYEYTTKGCIVKGNSCFDRIGVFDFTYKDLCVSDTTARGLSFIRCIQNTPLHKDNRNQSKVCLEYDCHPNMCNTSDYPYSMAKQMFADTHGEITSVWQCTEQNRKHAMELGIRSWKDPGCTVDTLGVTSEYYRARIKEILDINRQTEDSIRCVGGDIRTCSDTKRLFNFGDTAHKEQRMYYIDFETVTIHSRTVCRDNILTNQTTYIAMIGCGWENQKTKKWEFCCFVVDSLTMRGESRMIQQFYEHVMPVNSGPDPVLVHWGHAERSILNNAIARHSVPKWGDMVPFLVDLCNYFKKHIIVVRGSLTYGLKHIAKALYKTNRIKTTWPKSDCGSGMDAMIQLLDIHKDVTEHGGCFSAHKTIHDIVKYNEIDCRVLYDIMFVLVTKVTDVKS